MADKGKTRTKQKDLSEQNRRFIMISLKRIIPALLCGTILTTCISCETFDEIMDFSLNGFTKKHDNVYKYPHLIRVFSPSARIYFDTGSDDKDEIDIFNDGSISPAINLAEVYFPYGRWKNWDVLEPNSVVRRLEKEEAKNISYFKQFLFGPTLGFGITVPPGEAENGNNSSDAPVLFLNGGLLLLFPLNNSKDTATIGFEFGWTRGYSTSESIGDNDDSALYAGLTLNIPFGQSNNSRSSPDKQ